MSKKYHLVIVESPAKAKTIEKYLGEDYKVVASMGHIKDLPQKQLGINLENFELEIVAIDGKEDVIKELILLAKNADEVYLASDPDREGEAIAFHIQETIKRKDAHRVLFNAITKGEIIKAVQNPLKLDLKKYEAQKTRRILDRLVGYKISPILWDKLQRGLSAGRVQSVALRLIVEREDEIINFVPEKWFQILAKLKKEEIEFDAKYYGQTIAKKTEIETDEQAQAILKSVENQPFVVIDTQTKEKRQYATPPFTTSKLQQEASYKLGFPSKKTMQIAQKLYEGINVSGHGRQGLITYMRTDSVRTEPGALTAVRDFILQKYGQDYLPEAAVVHMKKKSDSKVQDAHEAIRPTNLLFEPDLIRKDLDPDEYKLYSLIWNKFIASQMNPAVLDQTVVSFDVNQNIFKSAGSVLKFPGFKAVYQEEKEEKKNTKGEEDEDKDQSGKLPILVDKESLTPIKPPFLQEKWTAPPARFNEGGLVKELEEKGIGRPSTYAAIISNITERGYVLKNKESRFQPTELGVKLCRMLVANFPIQMEISFTAKMEQNLDSIEDGQENWVEVLKNFWAQLSKTIEEVKVALPSIPREIKPEDKTDIKCEKCQEGVYLIKRGKEGEFLACSRYPQCKSTKNFKKDKKGVISFVEPKKVYYEGVTCPTCSKKMVVIKGKNGKFLSCEDYPNCKTTKPIPLDFICHKCEQGKLVERKSKKGNIFYGCSRYPSCDNVLWNKPIKEPCSACEHSYITLVEGKNKEGKKFKFNQCPKCLKKFEIKKAEK